MYTKLPIEQKEFVSYKIIELTQKYFTNMNSVCLSISHPSNCITSIINCNTENIELEKINTLKLILENELGLNYNIAISNSTNNLFALNNKYKILKNTLNYTFINGYNNIFTENDITNYKQNNGPSILNKLNHLESLLKSKDIEKLKNDISKTIVQIKENGYSYQYSQSLLLQTLNLISNMSITLNLDIDKAKILTEFNNITYIDDCISWIYNFVDAYFKQLSTLDEKINRDFINKIINYVCNNINSQISLKVVANEFNISTTYLSKIFQESTQTGFLEFVKNKKLEKASTNVN